MDKLTNTIVLTSQGVAFLHSGVEMERTKQGVANSFNSPDAINEIDWSRKTKYLDVFNYYKGLVALRKDHPAFRLTSARQIREHLSFMDTADPLVIAYQLTDNAGGDKWHTVIVLLNGSKDAKTVTIPGGNWTLVGDGDKVDEAGIRTVSGGAVSLPGITGLVLHD